MKIKYDKAVDAAYIELGDTRAPGRIKTREVGSGIALDFDSGKRLVGIEVLDASHHLHADRLSCRGRPTASRKSGRRTGAR